MMKIFRHLLKSNRGFSLMEITVAGGIMVVGGLAVAKLMGSLGSSTNRDAETVVEKTQFSSAISVYLNSGLGCADLKTAPENAAKAITTDTPLHFKNWRWGGFKEFKTGTQLRYLDIKALTGSLLNDTTVETINMVYSDGSSKTLTKAMLRVKWTMSPIPPKTLKNPPKPRIYDHFIDLPVLVNTDNSIEYCGDDRKLAETCAALDGQFNTANNTCKFKETCSAYGSYVTFNCYPNINGKSCLQMNNENLGSGGKSGVLGGSVNSLTGGYNCPGGSSSVATGADTWNVQVDCGKKCTADVNFSLGYFTCLKCL